MDIFQRNVKGTTEVLGKKIVGIAGCGGLGSNIAVSLVRAGVKNLVIADFDVVEASNLNRQHFFLSDIGKFKVEALADHLKKINPEVDLTIVNKELSREDITATFGNCDVMIEAFDKAENKKWLIEEWSVNFRAKPIICGNGISGYGDTESLKVKKVGNIYFCGDGKTDMKEGLCAPRILIVANMEANVAIEILLDNKIVS